MTTLLLVTLRWGTTMRLDAVVQLGREHVVALGDVLERDAVGDDVARLEVAVADVLEQSRGHCRLTGHWFIRSVRPLFIASPNLTALKSGP